VERNRASTFHHVLQVKNAGSVQLYTLTMLQRRNGGVRLGTPAGGAGRRQRCAAQRTAQQRCRVLKPCAAAMPQCTAARTAGVSARAAPLPLLVRAKRRISMCVGSGRTRDAWRQTPAGTYFIGQ